MMTLSPPVLVRPVGALCRRLTPLEANSSVERAASRLIEEETSVLPIVENGLYQGVLREFDLVEYQGSGGDLDALVGPLAAEAPMLPPNATSAEALRLFDQTGSPWIIIVDPNGWVSGVLTPARLMLLPDDGPRPRVVGGMATPMGVYLTNGAVGAGVPPLALVATGAILFGLFLLGAGLMRAAAILIGADAADSMLWHIAEQGGALLIFLIGLRALPLSGIHGAEHMVVHAIERGEPLRPSVVARMPRVHPRCGTNVAAGAGLFLSIMGINWVPDNSLRLLVALLATVILWRPVGSLLQQFLTTSQPSPAQIEMAIKSGEALLTKLEMESDAPPKPWQRIASSGMLQIMAGSIAVQCLAWLVFELFRVPAIWRPF